MDYQIALDLIKTKGYKMYLNEEESRVFEYITKTQKIFKSFIENPKSKKELVFGTNVDLLDQEKENTLLNISLKIRLMLTELSMNPVQAINTLEEQDLSSLIPFDDQYYSLEQDESLIPKISIFKQVKPKVVEKVEKPVVIPPGMKYLLEMVDNVKAVQKIVVDSIPSKSKWANDDRVGQEQLYEAFEKVLTGLKNYTEHSLPFLRPVQKREAPNYFDIIKNPMDLTTMTKKLKNLQYNNKDDFAADLELIWSNCLTYNTMPESIYRQHAFAMRRKTQELLKKIPEISIQSNKESDDESDDEGKSKVSEKEDVEMESVKEEKEEEEKEEKEDEEEHEDGINNQLQQEYMYDSCIITKKWKQITSNDRAMVLTQKQLNKQLKFGDWPALIRTEQDMAKYADNQQKFYEKAKIRQNILQGMENEIPELSYFLPETYNVVSSFPESNTQAPKFNFDVQDFLSPDTSESKLNMAMMKNIQEMKNIKDIYSKVLAKQNINEPQMNIPKPEPYTPLWDEKDLPPPVLNLNSSFQLIQKSCGYILSHIGFDSATEQALSTFSDIMMQLLYTAGRTMSAFIDKYGTIMQSEEILFHVLLELGVKDPIDLQTYINHDVIRYGNKLHELSRKLDYAWNEFGQVQQDDIEFEDQQENFYSGNFLEGAGIDFLNLKDIGLDFHIPMELWNRKADKPLTARVKRNLINTGPVAASDLETEIKVPAFEKWEPVDPGKQIKLLADFYSKLTPETMIEDEFKPKTKEQKMMVKYAQTGVRKKTNVLQPKKKEPKTTVKKIVKKEKKLKEKKRKKGEMSPMLE
ncbi:Transcriptional activator spt7 [Boothiomyces macroporosus]|uniref:Transcriptional activator spt7 n=1 Tax=Boothiomyces macroporosus TaxID=261099 RepID=A0AAD5U9S1_9FUNG|nr:Transcriptional activator spt7 [Boothiomyces macroporosus]